MNGPGQILPRAAQRFGERVALVTATRTLSYRELDESITRVASALRERGLRPGAAANEHDIIAFTEDRLAAYKRPRLVRFLGDLPKTSSGKVMRRELIKSFTP
jgi:acyl-CoA synthetase (AMP-forming)/AMP-acid ligase II